MRVKVRQLRQRGRLLRGIERNDEPAFTGDLAVAEARDIELGRPVLRARLLDISSGTNADVLPYLNDARLLSADGNKLRITGLERIDEADYSQTWTVELVQC